jgi:hypothetical protein
MTPAPDRVGELAADAGSGSVVSAEERRSRRPDELELPEHGHAVVIQASRR